MKTLLIKWKENSEKLVFAVVLVLVSILYFSRYWNRMLPYSEGWGLFYSDLLADGKVPYRDFYYYLPPLNLLIDFVFWKLSFGYLIIYRAWRFAERICIILMLYHLLCKVSKPRFASFAAFFGEVICAATVFDLIGDYNQTCDLMVLILCWVLTKYADAFHANHKKKEFFYLLASGFVIGLSFLLKQTIFLAEIIVFFFVLTVFFLIKRKSGYLINVLVTIGGAMVPVCVNILILLSANAFIPYIQQVYLDTSSKGNVVDILISPVRQFTLDDIFFAAVIAGVIYFLHIIIEKRYPTSKTVILSIAAYSYLFGIVNLIYGNEIKSSLRALLTFGIMVMIVFVVLCFMFGFKKHKDLAENMQMLIIFGLLSISILYVFIKPEYAQHVYNDTSAFFLVGKLSSVFSVAGLIFLFYLFCSYIKFQSRKTMYWLLLVAGGLACSYASIMVLGNSNLNNRAIVFLFPVLLLFLLEKPVFFNRFKNMLVVTIGLLICTICMSQKIANTYAWWGWSNAVINEDSNYGINVPGLNKFRVNQYVKTMYEEMYRVVNENTDANSVIYGFPYVRIFNVLCKNSNMSSFVPVPFYDVCGDKYAKQEVILLEQSPPDIVIWCDIANCMETHEWAFRNGEPLAQRDIQTWFSKAVIKGEYELIGQYDILYIYKKTDGDPITYTYIQNDGKRNATLLTAEELGIIAEFFVGDGSEESPYLIDSEESFMVFRKLVNSGCYFDNNYFRQTVDLDFSDYDTTVAIGRYETGTYFNGIYDGNQHTISGLNIQEDIDTGLFGVLGGTVQNLTLCDSTILGFCCGGIACHAVSKDAKIINCTVEETVELYGFRAGGIVDDFVGGVINCESAASVASYADQPTGKISSYYVGYVVNCIEK